MTVRKEYIGGGSTTHTRLRIGNFLSASTTERRSNDRGVPVGAVPVLFEMKAPDAAVGDYFVDGVDAEVVASATLSATAMDTNAATGRPYARSVTITLSAAQAPVLLVTGVNQHGETVSEVLDISSGTTAETATCFVSVTSIAVTTAAGAACTYDAGFGNKFELPHPCLGGVVLAVRLNAAGTAPPATAVAAADYTVVGGSLASASTSAFGTIAFTDSATDPDGTIDYSVYYLCDWFDDGELAQGASPKVGDGYPTKAWV